ncbi:hypothetical protein [Pelobacter seleniigenes]|uniref:hypothetical protein n=1 Tax=Pelobacter seleniigenes TaxID=407188 RepID=UPI0004A6F98E|nr:hypothetical protein [Pelobacter seleniigenes]
MDKQKLLYATNILGCLITSSLLIYDLINYKRPVLLDKFFPLIIAIFIGLSSLIFGKEWMNMSIIPPKRKYSRKINIIFSVFVIVISLALFFIQIKR